jgi:hypothetical protein
MWNAIRHIIDMVFEIEMFHLAKIMNYYANLDLNNKLVICVFCSIV